MMSAMHGSTTASVLAVHRSADHTFSKSSTDAIRLVAGIGVEGDAHAGRTVQHLSRIARDASQPNLRQVHLLQSELFEELSQGGFQVGPGDIGENVTTTGLDLLGLSAGARLRLGPEAVVEVTGLRTPCRQLDGLQRGLMAATLERDAAGGLVRRTGVMSVVVAGGEVRPGDAIEIQPPAGAQRPLEPV